MSEKILAGVVVKLSKVHKKERDGKLYILRCDCLKKGLWLGEMHKIIRFTGFCCCPLCHMTAWRVANEHRPNN
jgi:hypothetical protein